MFLQSSVCEKIMELLGQNKIDHHQRQVAILSQDSFYKELTPEQKTKALKGQFNFDHPGGHMLMNHLISYVGWLFLFQSNVRLYHIFSGLILDLQVEWNMQ